MVTNPLPREAKPSQNSKTAKNISSSTISPGQIYFRQRISETTSDMSVVPNVAGSDASRALPSSNLTCDTSNMAEDISAFTIRAATDLVPILETEGVFDIKADVRIADQLAQFCPGHEHFSPELAQWKDEQKSTEVIFYPSAQIMCAALQYHRLPKDHLRWLTGKTLEQIYKRTCDQLATDHFTPSPDCLKRNYMLGENGVLCRKDRGASGNRPVLIGELYSAALKSMQVSRMGASTLPYPTLSAASKDPMLQLFYFRKCSFKKLPGVILNDGVFSSLTQRKRATNVRLPGMSKTKMTIVVSVLQLLWKLQTEPQLLSKRLLRLLSLLPCLLKLQPSPTEEPAAAALEQ